MESLQHWSRFCNAAEANYSLTDGEFTGLVNTLEKTTYFTLGCKNLTIGTDHLPLMPIINGTDLENLKTPRQIRLKERLLKWICKWSTSRAKTWVALTPSQGMGCATTMTRP